MEHDHRSLEELDGHNWGEPETAPTGMVATCLRLRRTPLGALGPGDLQLLISQKIGLEYLMAKAIQVVSETPFLEAEFYPGDLLRTLLRVDVKYWGENPTELHWLVRVARAVRKRYGDIIDECDRFVATNSR